MLVHNVNTAVGQSDPDQVQCHCAERNRCHTYAYVLDTNVSAPLPQSHRWIYVCVCMRVCGSWVGKSGKDETLHLHRVNYNPISAGDNVQMSYREKHDVVTEGEIRWASWFYGP